MCCLFSWLENTKDGTIKFLHQDEMIIMANSDKFPNFDSIYDVVGHEAIYTYYRLKRDEWIECEFPLGAENAESLPSQIRKEFLNSHYNKIMKYLRMEYKLNEDNTWQITEYYEDGVVERIVTLNERGVMEGQHMTFYNNGKLKRITMFHNNRPVGVEHTYWKSGVMQQIMNYNIDGERHGTLSAFDEFGTLRIMENYENNQLHGISIHFAENGEIVDKIRYKHGTQAYEYIKNGNPTLSVLMDSIGEFTGITADEEEIDINVEEEDEK